MSRSAARRDEAWRGVAMCRVESERGARDEERRGVARETRGETWSGGVAKRECSMDAAAHLEARPFLLRLL